MTAGRGARNAAAGLTTTNGANPMAKAKRKATTADKKATKKRKRVGADKLETDGIAVGHPSIGFPAMGVVHVLEAVDLAAGAPEPREKWEREAAKRWLREIFPNGTGGLKAGEVLKKINEPTAANGSIGRDTLRRARRELGPPYLRT